MKRYVFIILLPIILLAQQFTWGQLYEKGIMARNRREWFKAKYLFENAIKLNPQEAGKIKITENHIIDYYPHRELGIVYYYLKRNNDALKELKISLKQNPSDRAKKYIQFLEGRRSYPSSTPYSYKTPQYQHYQQPQKTEEGKAVEEVGERMKIAVLPFETKGNFQGIDVGNIILDKMITSFVNQGRFKVMEREELEKILKEQQLGMSGIIDASTAARVGKSAGLDAILIGSLTRAGSNISVDARLIDTETAGIITSKDAYTYKMDAQSVKTLSENIAKQISGDIPLLKGFVVQVEDSLVYIDIGTNKGIKKGMKCDVYREGEEIKNPVTGEVLGTKIDILGEVIVKEVQPKMSICVIVRNGEKTPTSGDKVITK